MKPIKSKPESEVASPVDENVEEPSDATGYQELFGLLSGGRKPLRPRSDRSPEERLEVLAERHGLSVEAITDISNVIVANVFSKLAHSFLNAVSDSYDDYGRKEPLGFGDIYTTLESASSDLERNMDEELRFKPIEV